MGLLIYVFASPVEVDPLADYRHSKSFDNGVRHFAGGAGVLGIELTETLTAMFKGPNLGLTLGALSFVVAVIYFARTYRRSQPPKDVG